MRLVIRLKGIIPPPAFGLPVHALSQEEQQRRVRERTGQSPVFAAATTGHPVRTDQVEFDLQAMNLRLVDASVQEWPAKSQDTGQPVIHRATNLEYNSGPLFRPDFQPGPKRSLACLEQRFPKWITAQLERSWSQLDLWLYPESRAAVLNLFGPKPIELSHPIVPVRHYLVQTAVAARA